jgi:hypothetical protein
MVVSRRTAARIAKVAAVFAEVDGPLDQAQALVFRARHIGAARPVVGRRHPHVGEMRQAGIPQRARRAHLRPRRVEAGELPVPAGQRQVELRLAERLRGAFAGIVGRRHLGHQGAQKHVEPAIERALDRVAIERGEHEAGDQQDDARPAGRRQEETKGERVSAHRSAA